jgi:ankyrin repeat protein
LNNKDILNYPALDNHRTEIVKILIKAGADANIKDIYGHVPFIRGTNIYKFFRFFIFNS